MQAQYYCTDTVYSGNFAFRTVVDCFKVPIFSCSPLAVTTENTFYKDNYHLLYTPGKITAVDELMEVPREAMCFLWNKYNANKVATELLRTNHFVPLIFKSPAYHDPFYALIKDTAKFFSSDKGTHVQLPPTQVHIKD